MRNPPSSFPLLLRNEFRLYLRGMAKGASLVFLLISQFFLHLIALAVAWATSKNVAPAMSVNMLLLLSGGLMAMFMMMTSRALAGAVQSLYTRGDLDLLLSSPVDRRSVIGVRMGAIALTVGLEVALLVWPFANMFVLFGNYGWFKAYLLVPAMAMLATSVGLALTLASFRILGPRRTRVAVQILAVLVGISIMLVVYLPRILGSQQPGTRPGRDFSTGVDMIVRQTGGYRELLVTPAQWVTNGFLPTIAFFVAALALLAWTIHLTGDRIVNAMTAVSGSVARKVHRVADSAQQFRHGLRTVVVFKELKLIARDPHLIAQVLQQGLYTLPMAVGLWTARRGDLPMHWFAIIVLVVGIAGPLAWITMTAEDAPDLLASAPVSRTALFGAKIQAALLPVIPLCLLPLLLLRTHPWFAVCTSFSASAAAVCAALINMGNPVAKRRDSFKTRHRGNAGRGFLEVVSMLFWLGVAIGLTLAGRHFAGWR